MYNSKYIKKIKFSGPSKACIHMSPLTIYKVIKPSKQVFVFIGDVKFRQDSDHENHTTQFPD